MVDVASFPALPSPHRRGKGRAGNEAGNEATRDAVDVVYLS